jgi:hypothetical protein
MNLDETIENFPKLYKTQSSIYTIRHAKMNPKTETAHAVYPDFLII